MRLLHLTLIGWLAVSVPTATLASLVSAGHCQRQQPNQAVTVPDHDAHAAHKQHAMQEPPRAIQDDPGASGCSCGCNCLNQHCTTGFSGFLGAASIPSDRFDGATSQLLRAEPGHPASAHHLDLIRPPSLS